MGAGSGSSAEPPTPTPMPTPSPRPTTAAAATPTSERRHHGARRRCAAIVINPGALTHYAWSLHDALAAFDGPVVELHLSDPKAREAWRHLSVVEPVAARTIAGHGGAGYRLALDAVAELLGC